MRATARERSLIASSAAHAKSNVFVAYVRSWRPRGLTSRPTQKLNFLRKWTYQLFPPGSSITFLAKSCILIGVLQNAPICPDHREFYILEVILHVHIKATGSNFFSVSVSRSWLSRTSSTCLSVVVVQNFISVSLGRGRPVPQNFIGVSLGRSRPVPQNFIGVSLGRGRPVPQNFIGVSLGRGCPELHRRVSRSWSSCTPELHRRVSRSWLS